MATDGRRRTVDAIDPEHVRQLNQAFYSRDPYVYFQRRLGLLLLSEAPDSNLGQLLSDHTAFEWLRNAVGHQTVHLAPEALSGPKAGRFFPAAEGVMLFHQVAESLLRLIFAHVEEPPCPWMRMVEDRTPQKFAARVKRDLCDVTLDEAVQLLTPLLVPPSAAEDGIEIPESIVANTVASVRRIAGRFLDETDLFNSCKHGMSASIGGYNTSFDIGEGPEQQTFSSSGPTLEYLAWAPNTAEGRGALQLVTVWPDVDERLALIYIATRLMESLWTLAAWRYIGRNDAQVSLFAEHPDSYVSALNRTVAQTVRRLGPPGDPQQLTVRIFLSSAEQAP